MIILMSMTPYASANEWYIGAGIGKSTLNYNVNDFVNNYLVDNEYQTDVAVLAQYGFPLNINSDLTSKVSKLTLGYSFTDRLAVELNYKNYGSYAVQATLGVNGHGSAVATVAGYTERVTWNGNINAKAEATASANGISLTGLYAPLKDGNLSLFLRAGVEYVDATYTTTAGYNYNYSVDCGYFIYENQNKSSSVVSTKTSHVHGAVPLVGLGVDYKLNSSYTVRAEWERSGNVTKFQDSIDMVSINVLYHF